MGKAFNLKNKIVMVKCGGFSCCGGGGGGGSFRNTEKIWSFIRIVIFQLNIVRSLWKVNPSKQKPIPQNPKCM